MGSIKGHFVSESTKRKISDSLKNEGHFAWNPEPSYDRVHYWMRKNAKKSGKCNQCGESKRTDWALIKGKQYERKIENFKELCRKCHYHYDLGHKLRVKPTCKNCGVKLKDWYAKRCGKHAQQHRFGKI